jgi:hypothetical protein
MVKSLIGRVLTVLLGLALLSAGNADAHGPTRQKVVQTIEIAATPAAIWKIIGNFHDMSWNPAVVKTTGEGGNTVNCFRTITLKSGGELTESLDGYDAEQFTYRTFLPHNDPKVFPVADFSTVLTVTAEDGGKSLVEWRGAAYRGYPNNDPPPELNDDAAVAAITAYLTTGLEALKAKIEGGKH